MSEKTEKYEAWRAALPVDELMEFERYEFEAFLALRGASSAIEGARAVAKLLRTDWPLDPLIRSAMADALDPPPENQKRSEVRLKLTNLQEGKRLRSVEAMQLQVKRGEKALTLIERHGMKWKSATEEIANSAPFCSVSQVEKGIEEARRFRAHCKKFEDRNQNGADFRVWEMEYFWREAN